MKRRSVYDDAFICPILRVLGKLGPPQIEPLVATPANWALENFLNCCFVGKLGPGKLGPANWAPAN